MYPCIPLSEIPALDLDYCLDYYENKKKTDLFDIDVTSLVTHAKKETVSQKLKNFAELNEFVKIKKNQYSAFGCDSLEIKDKLHSQLGFLNLIREEPKIIFQTISDSGFLLPHRDVNRLCSIMICLNDNTGINYFYEDVTGNTSMFSLPENIKKIYTYKMSKGVPYLFDNQTIHSLYLRSAPKIAVCLNFYAVPYTELVMLLGQYHKGISK